MNKKNMNKNKNNIQAGRYRISPMSRPHDEGGFAASVSIRSGQGMASVDRVMQFTPLFHSPRAALRYAAAEGLTWARSH
jgi:hypothetical protein